MAAQAENHQNEVQFDKHYSPRSLSTGITEEEGNAFIARMMEVYPFPKNLPA